MTPLFFFLLFVLPAATPDDSVWVGGDKGLREVPIYYLDIVPCNSQSEHIKGCYKHMEDIIIFKNGIDVYSWAMPGCTIWDHEIYHAWGYDHVEMEQFNCPHPNTVNHNSMQYDENNVAHWNPMYIWEGYH